MASLKPQGSETQKKRDKKDIWLSIDKFDPRKGKFVYHHLNIFRQLYNFKNKLERSHFS